MALDPRIILAGQQPDFVNTLARSNVAAAGANQINTQNKLRDLYQSQGPQIMAGDQGALNALAQIDPQAGLGIQRAQAQEGRASESHKIKIAEYAKGLTREQAAQQAAEIESGLKRAIPLFQVGDLDGINQLLTSVGEQPISDLNQFPAVAAMYGDALAVLKGVTEFSAPPKPGFDIPAGYQLFDPNKPELGVRPVAGMPTKSGFRPATPEESAQYGAKAGQVDDETGRFYPINPPKGMKITSDGRGGFTLTEGSGVGADGETLGTNPASPQSMVDTIDGILADPALDTSTGMLEWMQGIPGTDAKRFGTRVDQLNGQAFLQAFESLKGAGQITEIEGTKATQAVGRLDSAQKAEDYRQALKELRDILVIGQSRPKGWTGNREQTAPDVGTIEGKYEFLGGDPAKPTSWRLLE